MSAVDPSRQAASAGLLIVNADDWGIDAPTTDAIAECFRAGLITSATAMVFMADSERAARLAREIGLPVGLHLNLSEPFTGGGVPDAVRMRQARLTGRFGDRHRRWRRWIPDPSLRAEVDRCVLEQLARFQELYGRPPTHVDGHKHVHVSPTVARTPALARVALRRAVDDPPGARPAVVLARRLRHRLTVARPHATEHFMAITSMSDELRADRQPAALKAAEHASVEVMAHPGSPRERELLMTAAWARTLRSFRLGSYEDLR